jgi:hypothetical protein
MNYFTAGFIFFFSFNLTINAQTYKSEIDIPSPGLKLNINKNYHDDSLHLRTFNLSQLEFDPLATKLNYPVLLGLGSVYLGTIVGVHIYKTNTWWNERSKFHFQNDWDYALWFDKFGHFFGGHILVHTFSVGLEAGNVQTEQAMLYGAALAFAFQTYVEIEDGFSADWGFSPGDFTANTLGVGFALVQYYFPYLQNFHPKFSYFPSKELREGKHKGNMFDDFYGQKLWLSFRMKNLLPKEASEFWPSFLNLAVGVGVKDLDGIGGGRREIFIALDLDALALPLEGKFGNFIKNTLNYIHFPMPGLRISPDAAFFVLLF